MASKQIAQSSALQKYLSVLNATNLRTLEDYIIASVMEVAGAANAPIRLAPHVSKFLINPSPIYTSAVENGRLEYDPHSNRFNILLSKAVGIASEDDTSSGRLRFTYAHEVGHRFCFVSRNGEWQRAVQIVISELGGAARVRALRSLSLFEERLCNDIAGRLLIPDDLLKKTVKTFSQDAHQPSLADFIANIARTFHVTKWCALVRIHKAIRRGLLETVEGFCALLIRYGPRAGRIDLEPKVSIAIVPKMLQGNKVQSVFPGAPLEKFGREIVRSASEFSQAREGTMQSSITLQIEHSRRSCNPIERAFSANWSTLGHKKFENGGSILVWGFLDQSSTAKNSAVFLTGQDKIEA